MPKSSLFLSSLLTLLVFEIPDNCRALELGVTASYNHSFLSGQESDEFGSRNSLSGGLFSSIRLSKNFSIEMGIQHVRSGADGPAELSLDFDSGPRLFQINANHQLDYIAFPIKLRASLPFRIGSLIPSVALGLVPAVNLSATTEFLPANNSEKVLFEIFDISTTRDIQNVKSTDLWMVVAPALDLPVSGHVLRIQGEFTLGLTTPFGDRGCILLNDGSRRICEETYVLFNNDIFGPPSAKPQNRSLAISLSLIF